MLEQAKWIASGEPKGDVCPVFRKTFAVPGVLRRAVLTITAMGVYEATVNGSRVGTFILAPGWTVYQKRLQVQSYDVTELVRAQNTLEVVVGKGWYHTPLQGWEKSDVAKLLHSRPMGLTAQLDMTFADGRTQTVATDDSWLWAESPVRFSEIYDGEFYDATVVPDNFMPVRCFDEPTQTLIPQQGEEIREQDRIAAQRIFTTPCGETVVDFGQNVTGYVQIDLPNARFGQEIALSHAEVLDRDGNFYTANYRDAKAQYRYRCAAGAQTCKPRLTYFGFRYVRLDSFPGGAQEARPEWFTAIAVHSQMERTGFLECSNPLLNRLFDNILWGQKGNFLDVPTDCPQRDERLGWTGDAQVFIRTACLQFDVQRFFTKWLADMMADQNEDGRIPHVVPRVMAQDKTSSAAWGDAATVCPWELYRAYGDVQTLREHFPMMKKWVAHITAHTTTPNLWTGCWHFGDWLGLDAPQGSYRGSSRQDFIASAFYAHSTFLVMEAAEVLGEDVSEYRALYRDIVAAFRRAFPQYQTQTECVLAAHFRLAPDPQAAADQLAQHVRACGHLQTGFVGTPYLLHVLSDFGYAPLAYELLLRREYPSWLYPVTKGATTVWEHWDGIRQDGSFWSDAMNSFNHYAYGAVADWVYTVAAGIRPDEAGYASVRIAPVPDARLEHLSAALKTRHGTVVSRWRRLEETWKYEITTPVPAHIVIEGREYQVEPGSYRYYGRVQPVYEG